MESLGRDALGLVTEDKKRWLEIIFLRKYNIYHKDKQTLLLTSRRSLFNVCRCIQKEGENYRV